MVPIAKADVVVPQLSAITVLGLFRARAGALLQESLQKELVPPEHGAGLGGVKEAIDVPQGIRLVHALENGRNLSGSVVWKGLGRLWRNSEITWGGMFEGAFQPP